MNHIYTGGSMLSDVRELVEQAGYAFGVTLNRKENPVRLHITDPASCAALCREHRSPAVLIDEAFLPANADRPVCHHCLVQLQRIREKRIESMRLSR